MRVLFAYWGRRGALTPLIRALKTTCETRRDIDPIWSFSTSFEAFAEFAAGPSPVVAIDTFTRAEGLLLSSWRVPKIRGAMRAAMRRYAPEAVVVLMPHVWTPFVSDLFRINGARYLCIVHDAKPHAGDPTAVVTPWLVAEALRADVVAPLSQSTADILRARIRPHQAMLVLPSPAFGYAREVPPPAAALRVLFFGRILPYKGLDMLVDAVERARVRGAQIDLGVAGEGHISPDLCARLDALGAEVIRRWIDEREAGAILGRYDVMALPYLGASQSGVAAVALAAAMPVVATPVGALPEQVRDGVNGVLAADVTAAAIADALVRLAADRGVVAHLAEGARRMARSASIDAFVDRLLGALRR